MSGQVVFAITTQQAAVLRKLSIERRDFTEPERIAFFALARRGLVRGTPDEPASPPRLTRAGSYAASLACELELPMADLPAGTFGRGIERRRGDRRAAGARVALASKLEPELIVAK